LKVIICIAYYNKDRLPLLLKNIDDCSLLSDDILVLVDTNSKSENVISGYNNIKYFVKRISGGKRKYASVMYEKIRTCRELVNNFDNTIFVNLDDDVFLNQSYFKFLKRIYEENESVDYVSLLRGPGVIVDEKNEANLSGFRFFRHHSCMGNSLTARWSVFKEDVLGFFEYFNVSGEDAGRGGMFDQIFFNYLSSVKNKEKVVYTIRDFSLMQHCNLGSVYADERKDKLSHMYAINFDPRMNPFQFAGVR
jgi:hypothetical protein